MRKTFCDRCGEEIRERPDMCQAKLPKYRIEKIINIGQMNVFAHAVEGKEVDLCPHCMDDFEAFMAGGYVQYPNDTEEMSYDREQE